MVLYTNWLGDCQFKTCVWESSPVGATKFKKSGCSTVGSMRALGA